MVGDSSESAVISTKNTYPSSNIKVSSYINQHILNHQTAGTSTDEVSPNPVLSEFVYIGVSMVHKNVPYYPCSSERRYAGLRK